MSVTLLAASLAGDPEATPKLVSEIQLVRPSLPLRPLRGSWGARAGRLAARSRFTPPRLLLSRSPRQPRGRSYQRTTCFTILLLLFLSKISMMAPRATLSMAAMLAASQCPLLGLPPRVRVQEPRTTLMTRRSPFEAVPSRSLKTINQE